MPIEIKDIFHTIGGPPSASKENKIFPRRHLSLSDSKWGLEHSMLPIRYHHKRTDFGRCQEYLEPRMDEQKVPTKPPVPAGVAMPSCHPPLPNFPGREGDSRYKCFPWYVDKNWKEQEKIDRAAMRERNKKKLEIPQSDPYKGRYPYWYSSARPSYTGATKKVQDLTRCRGIINPVQEKMNDPENFRFVEIFETYGFETSEMQARLKPLQVLETNYQEGVPKPNKVPRGLMRPTVVKWQANDAFGQYVTDTLKPRWTKDPVYRKKVLFRSKSMDQDVREWDNMWHKDKPKQKRMPITQKFRTRN